MVRRWRRAVILPETVLLGFLILSSAWFSDHNGFGMRAGQTALAAGGATTGVTVIQDGVPSIGADSRKKQRQLQQRLRRDPDSLMTLTGGDVLRAFNYADLQRQEGALTMFQFRGDGCVLDVYVDSASLKSRHFEFRKRSVAGNDGVHENSIRARDCVEDILRSRRV